MRVEEHWSAPRPVNGGVPQGSILGVFLFNVATDDLEVDAEARGVGAEFDDGEDTDSDGVWDLPPALPQETGAASTPVRYTATLDPELSPVRVRGEADPLQLLPLSHNLRRRERAASRRIVYSSEEEEAIPPEYSRKNARWRGRMQTCFKYVDDNLKSIRSIWRLPPGRPSLDRISGPSTPWNARTGSGA